VRPELLTLAQTPGAALALAAELRARVPGPESVADAVAEIVADVRRRGDAALAEYGRRFEGESGEPARVPPAELAAALTALTPDLRTALELARANIEAVAAAGVPADVDVLLPQGHRVRLRELAVDRAAIYAPGGRAPYPSTVLMGVMAARAAGVPDVVVCSPGGALIHAACALCGVQEVHRIGGAQAIAALALGTATVAPVDVVVGPGNLYVQEAKRQLSGLVGIDGFAGPSDLVVLAAAGADPGLIALDLLAQAEHGPGTLVVALCDDEGLLDAVQAALGAGTAAAQEQALCALVTTPTVEAGLALAEALAPEHLQLCGPEAEARARSVRRAGCLFVGPGAGTAFGDYVAGSNHVLPTGGAARHASGLSPRHFMRRMAEVRIEPAAAARLAPAGSLIAEAEGFAAHAESMRARMGDNGGP